jgi:hypothetical protein
MPPGRIFEFRWLIFDCKEEKMPDVDPTNRHPAYTRFFERAKLHSCASKATLFCFLIVP